MSIRLCAVCKIPLEEDRLQIADTRLCAAHAREIEKYGGEFLIRSQQERTSKPGSLKLNYGGVTVARRRNVQGVQKLRDDFLTR